MKSMMQLNKPSEFGSSDLGIVEKKDRKVIWLILRWGVTISAFIYLFSIVSVKELVIAFSRISVYSGVFAFVFCYISISLGAVRWWTLLAAYGAPYRPNILKLLRLHLVGMFFNTYLPGSISGDLIRGIATRDSFGKHGTTGALTVVFIERIAGLVGLLILVSCVFILNPLPSVGGVWIWSTIVISGAVFTVAMVAFGRRLAIYLPRPLGRFLTSLPELKSIQPFVVVIALSIMVHLIVAIVGHVLVSSIDQRIVLRDSLVFIPLAIVATFFPLTVAGAGAREAVFVVLYGTVGVAKADAMAGSLSLLLLQLIIAATGGLIYLFPSGRDISSS